MGYVRILVAVDGLRAEAAAVACRLAADRHALLTLVAPIEVPTALPLEARMSTEETDARELLREARDVAELYGVSSSGRAVRARSAGEAIVDAAVEADAELVVLGAPRRSRTRLFDSSVAYVLAHAPCRVVVVAPPAA